MNIRSEAPPSLFLNDLLLSAGISPDQVIVARHKPKEPKLNKVLPWLVTEHSELFIQYQAVQDARVAQAFGRRDYLASFIGLTAGSGVFAGLYRIGANSPLTDQEFLSDPRQQELFAHGMTSQAAAAPSRFFELTAAPGWEPWIGKLTVAWPGKELSWFRLAEKNLMPITAITEESRFVTAMPPWHDLSLSWRELGLLPASWKARLAEWRGVYFVFDTQVRLGYVGAAYGADNLLGRWLDYRRTGHGGNARLRQILPENLRFSILQRTSPDMPTGDVIALESSWKLRLNTRDYGLNAN